MARHDGFWPPGRRVGDGERYIFAVLEERGLVYRVRALTPVWAGLGSTPTAGEQDT
jgi:hypothetical protein